MFLLSVLLALQVSLNFDVESTAEKLRDAYKNDDYEAFTESFPTNFDNFLSLYGFVTYEGGRILYYEACDHVKYLFSDRRIIDENKLDIILQLSYGFKWDADAPCDLQIGTRGIVQNYPKQIADWLKKKTDKDIIYLFRMCLVELFPEYIAEKYNEYILIYSPISKRITALLKTAYKLALDDSDKIVFE